jgi:hypothetical protein
MVTAEAPRKEFFIQDSSELCELRISAVNISFRARATLGLSYLCALAALREILYIWCFTAGSA